MSGYGKSDAHLYDVEDVEHKKPSSLKNLPSSLKNVIQHGEPTKPLSHRKHDEKKTKERLAEAEKRRKKKRYLIYCGIAGLAFMILLATLLGIFLPGKDDDDKTSPTPSPMDNSNSVMYGDVVYLQNLGFEQRWLTGGHGNGMEEVYTRNAYDEVETDGNLDKFRWRIDSSTGASGECVKFGDKVHLKLLFPNDDNGVGNTSDEALSLWLTGGRGEGNKFAYTRDPNSALLEQALLDDGSYEWIVRTMLGGGSRSRGERMFGSCVMYQDDGIDDDTPDEAIYLQSNKLDFRWLLGSRTLYKDVVESFNFFVDDGDFGASVKPNYQWKILRDLGTGALPE